MHTLPQVTAAPRILDRAAPPAANPGASYLEPAPATEAFRAGPEFVVELATSRVADPAFQATWRALVAASDSPQKIYQSPEFFRFLSDSCQDGSCLEVLALVRLRDAAIVGVVPVRVGSKELNFNIGPVSLYRARVEIISLLGSIPAAPLGESAVEFLATQLLVRFPAARAVFSQALPMESTHWKNLAAMAGRRELATALLGGWRACHTMPLPATFDGYLAKLSSKKRYNLNRQLRVLGEQLGPLQLTRVERAEQVPAMMRALQSLMLPSELATLLGVAALTSLAHNNLLLCYVLHAGEQVIAAVVGTRSPDTLHIHNIFDERKHLALSVGTSAMHLAIKDLVELGYVRAIDFGYGTPRHEFRSSHLLETRAQVLVYNRMKAVSLLFFVHGVFFHASEALIGMVKSVRNTARALRQMFVA